MKLSYSFLCFVMLCSCSKSPRTVSTTHTGDLGEFILRTIEKHGGYVRTTNELPQIQCGWRKEVLTGAEYLDTREQVTIRIAGDRFQQVTGFLAQALGPPTEPLGMHTNGFLHGWYSRADIGVGLQFYQGRNETGLILVGELKR